MANMFIIKPIINVEKQTTKIKRFIPDFTLHKLRNIIVLAMAEQELSATLISGALGHNNTNTLKEYLSMPYATSSKIASDVIDAVINNKD